MTARRTAYTAEWVLPVASAPIRNGVVVVEDGRIAFVGPEAGNAAAWENAAIVRLERSALMPGLVNTHSHLELTALRGFLEGLDFRAWLRTLTTVRKEFLDADALLDSARWGLREALRNGITCLADTSASGTPLRAMREAGVRGIGYVETFGPDPVQAEESLATLRRAVDGFRAEDTPLVRVGVSPHAPYSVSVPLFRAVADLALREGLPVAVHIAESAAETAFVRDGAGPFAEGLRERGIHVAGQARSPVALLESTGLLAAKPLLIHAVQVDETDVATIAASGSTVAHCPISNAKLGHGVAPLERLIAAGIVVGLGTDSVASNDRMDMLGEARQAALLQALRRGVPDALSATAAIELATLGGARALGLDDRIGSLEVGKDADMVAFPLDAPDVQPVHEPAVSLVHVTAGAVHANLVMVGGQVLVRDGTVLADASALEVRMSLLGERLRQWRLR